MSEREELEAVSGVDYGLGPDITVLSIGNTPVASLSAGKLELNFDHPAIAQALTASGYGGFEVVPLEWEECDKEDPFLYIARTLSGNYSIGRGNAAGEYFAVHDGAFMWEWWPGESEDGKDTEQAAFAACEADHRERVSNMGAGELTEHLGTDPHKWAHACIQHAKAAGPAFGEDAQEATLEFVATWFANAMMAKSDALTPAGYGRWKVKPLMWEEDYVWSAPAFGYDGFYIVYETFDDNDNDVWRASTLDYPTRDNDDFPTLEAAKAACEADHASRVMGEMEEAPGDGVGSVEAIAKAKRAVTSDRIQAIILEARASDWKHGRDEYDVALVTGGFRLAFEALSRSSLQKAQRTDAAVCGQPVHTVHELEEAPASDDVGRDELEAACKPTLNEKAWEDLGWWAEAARCEDDPGLAVSLEFLIERETRIRAALPPAPEAE